MPFPVNFDAPQNMLSASVACQIFHPARFGSTSTAPSNISPTVVTFCTFQSARYEPVKTVRPLKSPDTSFTLTTLHPFRLGFALTAPENISHIVVTFSTFQ